MEMSSYRRKVNTKGVKLSNAALKFLDTKKPSTGSQYGSCLKRFVLYYENSLEHFVSEIERHNLENKSLPVISRTRYAEDVARKWIKWHEDLGYAPKSILQSLAALQNFMQYYGLNLSYRFIERPPSLPLKVNDKHRWSLDQVRKFVDSAQYIRDKAIMLCIFQSGLGIGDLVELNYGDVRLELTAGKLPLMLNVVRKKTQVEFKTFFGRDAVHYLNLYLKSRGSMEDDDPLFTKLGSDVRITDGAVQVAHRRYAEKLDFIDEQDLNNGWNPTRPHSLRAAFTSRLTGKVDRVLIEFWMGHDIGEEKRAYLNMPNEELRQIYANYEHLVSIDKTSLDEVKNAEPVIPEEAMNRIKSLEDTVLSISQKNTELGGLLDRAQRDKERLEADFVRGLDEELEYRRKLEERLDRLEKSLMN